MPSYNAQIHAAVVSTFALLIVDVLLGASFIRATFSNLDSLLDSFNTTEFLRAIGYSIPNGAYFFIVLVRHPIPPSAIPLLVQRVALERWCALLVGVVLAAASDRHGSCQCPSAK